MNKQTVDKWIPDAYGIIEKLGILKDGKLDKGYRQQLSAFGAAISMGSLLSAISFFSQQGGSEFERPKLMEAILKLVDPEKTQKILFDYAQTHKDTAKENILNATIALKLAMNLFPWKEDNDV